MYDFHMIIPNSRAHIPASTCCVIHVFIFCAYILRFFNKEIDITPHPTIVSKIPLSILTLSSNLIQI